MSLLENQLLKICLLAGSFFFEARTVLFLFLLGQFFLDDEGAHVVAVLAVVLVAGYQAGFVV